MYTFFTFLSKIKIQFLIIIFLLVVFFNKSYAQCAGSNNTVTICNKETDINLQNFNLFNQLGGSPTSGGEWTSDNPLNAPALNTTTGVVNLWSINRFGKFSFTYTNSACNESATVTINLGGYPGEDNVDGGANACSNNSAVNLFTFLDNESTDLSSDINGTWEETTPTGALSGNFFNATQAGVGTYTFTYKVGAVDTCTEKVATVVLEVHRAPNAGEESGLIFCQDDDLSSFINFDLFTLLVGEDSNGTWSENGTNQISNTTDSTINIQEIYNNSGAGTYNFTYTVLPSHGVCPEDTSVVSITILGISGEFLIENQCTNNSIPFKIKHSNSENAALTYDVSYEVIDANNNVIHTDIATGLLMNTDANLSINSANTLPSGNYTIRAKNISNVSGGICSSFAISESNFTLYNAEASITEQCFEGTNANITISNFTNAIGALSNETIKVDYEVKDLDNNTVKSVTDYEITFSNGSANLPIDISTFDSNAANFNLIFTNNQNTGLSCINFDFTARLKPKDIDLKLQVDNKCDASKMEVLVDAPTLPNGQYTVTYEVTKLGSTEVLIDNTIEFVGGRANYQVDISNLEEGNYEVVLKSTQNDTNPCRTQFEFELKESFSIGGVPDTPTLSTAQTFCFSDYQPNGPTIADIIVDSGENLIWYADETSTTPLSETTVLENGENYFVEATDGVNNCQSSEKAVVVITIITTSTVTSSNQSPVFCKKENPTIANLEASTNEGDLVWYDAESNGNILTLDTPLENGKSYFAVEKIESCESSTKLQFDVTIINPPTPIFNGNTSLCALDKPTLLDMEEFFSTNDTFELIWYDTLEGGSEISNTDLIIEGTKYYVAYTDPNTNCEGNRTEISFILSECDPTVYKFFIPDGFSPNNDGVNDNYLIPNIQYFYPDYELEIFNRYGQSLFKGDINLPNWNGSNNKNGKTATTGVYFYVLKFNKDNLKPKQGRIYLSK